MSKPRKTEKPQPKWWCRLGRDLGKEAKRFLLQLARSFETMLPLRLPILSVPLQLILLSGELVGLVLGRRMARKTV